MLYICGCNRIRLKHCKFDSMDIETTRITRGTHEEKLVFQPPREGYRHQRNRAGCGDRLGTGIRAREIITMSHHPYNVTFVSHHALPVCLKRQFRLHYSYSRKEAPIYRAHDPVYKAKTRFLLNHTGDKPRAISRLRLT